jgi:uncharacterized protein YjbI with pentapeptide repeats
MVTKIKLSIKNRFSGVIIFEYEKENNTIAETVKECIRQANEKGERANLSYADLRSADLSYANLSSADLRYANLRYADLSSANLRYADLSSANLRSADLRSANLRYADLSSANLRSADLRSANLSSANLSYANLRYADLSSADLSSANLSSADLRSADLRSANLSSADLRSADLRSADLSSIKNDLFVVLLHGKKEIGFLKENIVNGNIDGSTYDGKCACLSGTLANAAKHNNGKEEGKRIKSIMDCRDSSRPIERFFLGIKKGDTPENNQVSKLVLEWIEEFETLLKQ